MVQSATDDDHDSEPSPKKFKHIKKLIIEKRRAAKESAVETMLQPEEVEVKKYTEMNTSSNSLDDDRDPFIFWQQNEYAYPLLSKAAFDLLSTPP